MATHTLNWEKIRGIVLIGIILLAVYVRFIPYEGNVSNEDEWFNFISAVKLHTHGETYDARLFNYEQPPLGKYLIGLFVDPNKEYTNVHGVLPNVYYYTYLTVRELEPEIPLMRATIALFSVLALIPFFLLTRKLAGTNTALLASAVMSVSIGFTNLARVATQDGGYPFFFFLACWLSVEYFSHLNASEKGRKVLGLAKETLLLAGLFASLVLAGLVRLGQSFVLAVAVMVAALFQPGKRKVIFASVILAGILVLGIYSFDALRLTNENRGGNLVPIEIHTSWINGFISQNGYAVLALLLFAFFYALNWLQKNKVNNLVPHLGKKGILLSPAWKMTLIILGVSLLAMIFTEGGTQPRYYMVFFGIPIIILSQMVEKHGSKMVKIGIMLLLVMDAGLVVAHVQELPNYTTLGISPNYFVPSTSFTQVQNFLANHTIQTFYTNDPWIMDRYPDALAIPPQSKRFVESKQCTEEFFQGLTGEIIVYHHSTTDEIGGDKYVCRQIRNLKLTMLAAFPTKENPVYQVFKVLPN